jgi:hypothetical protein
MFFGRYKEINTMLPGTQTNMKSCAPSVGWLDADVNSGLGSFLSVRLQHRSHSPGVVGFINVYRTAVSAYTYRHVRIRRRRG